MAGWGGAGGLSTSGPRPAPLVDKPPVPPSRPLYLLRATGSLSGLSVGYPSDYRSSQGKVSEPARESQRRRRCVLLICLCFNESIGYLKLDLPSPLGQAVVPLRACAPPFAVRRTARCRRLAMVDWSGAVRTRRLGRSAGSELSDVTFLEGIRQQYPLLKKKPPSSTTVAFPRNRGKQPTPIRSGRRWVCHRRRA